MVPPDIQKCGGLLESKRIGELASLYAIPIAPDNISSPLGMVASCHVCATLPNFLVLEFPGQDVPFYFPPISSLTSGPASYSFRRASSTARECTEMWRACSSV
jgi:L-alanine-DL-glutamate epimerase-like enolase superfamily enzyme